MDPLVGPGHQARPDTPTRILDVAERLVQTRGFNGFSYADVATELNVTKAALHYHFAEKSALGEALIERYAVRFFQALSLIDEKESDARTKLEGYTDLYAEVLREERMCLCGMLASEYATLPKRMQAAVVRYFDDNERWLEAVLEQGRADGTLGFAGSARETAQMIIGSLEGAMLVARPYEDLPRFSNVAKRLLAGLYADAQTQPGSDGAPSSDETGGPSL